MADFLRPLFPAMEAEKQAHDFVMELRQKFKLKSLYPSAALRLFQARYGVRRGSLRCARRRMRYNSVEKHDEIGVLVGNFQGLDDPTLEKTMQKIKYLKPDCLDPKRNVNSAQSFAALRSFYRQESKDELKKSKGPMGSAFATRNPLLPEEFFSVRGVDPLVIEMNRDGEYSLLKNPAKYTVKVASFNGYSTMKLDEIEKLSRSSGRTKLEEAAEKAHILTVALRKQGVEAYEFHDRSESLVTVGSFDSVGRLLPNGATEFNPTVCEILKRYGAEQKVIPGQNVVGMQPKFIVPGIQMDVQPIPIEVPRISVAANYARNRAID